MTGITAGSDIKDQEKKKDIDFDMEVGEILNMQPWKESAFVSKLL